MIKMQDLADLDVIIPDVDEQKKMIEKEQEIGYLYAEFVGTLAAIKAKEKEFWSFEKEDYLKDRFSE